ncbi:MAG: lactonase family protein [Alphaproteobacteria bacterium]
MTQILFAGTYTEPILFGTGQVLQGTGKGIHAYAFDAAAGALAPLHVNAGIRNPSYLAFDPARRFLYCVNEYKEFEGRPSGAVSAFRIEGDSGRLTFLNQKATHGTDPCHLIVDKTGRNLYVANFASGSVCVLPIGGDGSLGDASCVVQHEGSSVDPVRQKGPHAHAVELSNDNRFAFVPELGVDRLMIYATDVANGTLAPNPAQPWIAVRPGAGPRQLVMHPNGRNAYLINELDSTMTAYAYDADSGTVAEINTLSTLPAGFAGRSSCAEVQIAPDGRHLYGSNRGHDSIAIFAIDPADGAIAAIGHESTRGAIPRNFEIDPTGAFLAAANQDTGNIVMFRRDADSGLLSATGSVVELGTPICVRFR